MVFWFDFVQKQFYISDEMETARWASLFMTYRGMVHLRKSWSHDRYSFPVQRSQVSCLTMIDSISRWLEKVREASIKLRGWGDSVFDVSLVQWLEREESRSGWKCLQNVCSESRQQVMFLEGADGVGKNRLPMKHLQSRWTWSCTMAIFVHLDSNKNNMDNLKLLGASLRVHNLSLNHALERTQQNCPNAEHGFR